MDDIYLADIRTNVDKKYVGFNPNTSSIKPVHIANGVFITIAGMRADTNAIHKLSYVSKKNGDIPKGHELKTTIEMLRDQDALDNDINLEDLSHLRYLMQKLLSADSGVFPTEQSYTAGSKMFITAPDRQHESAGIFIGGVLKRYCPEITRYIQDLLSSKDDPISLLFYPVSGDDSDPVLFEEMVCDELDLFNDMPPMLRQYIDSLQKSSNTLCNHLKEHTNKLSQLRLFVLFCNLAIIRYLLLLEAFYDGAIAKPILADFTYNGSSSISSASIMSYTQIHRAISRFYTWGFEQELKNYKIDELLVMTTPSYKKGKRDKKEIFEEKCRLWEIAHEDANAVVSEHEKRRIYATTIYDMLALDASANPIKYMRTLGVSSGILYPPTNLHPNKRFLFSQDVVEMLLRSCVEPNKTLSSNELRNNLWQRFGIIVGGREIDVQILRESGFIAQIDEDSLRLNFNNFAELLSGMNFAEIMADGILQINLGGAKL